MADFQSIAQQFVKYYYETFDSDRALLGSLYRDNSMLTFEDESLMGTAKIIQKLVELKFSKVVHEVISLDAQPASLTEGAILVLVCGRLLVDEEQRPMSYTQVFQLRPDGASWYVLNDMFKLVYAAA